MSGFDNEVLVAKNADFSTAGANKGSVANGLNADGKIWIGSTTPNVGGTQVNVGNITSPNGTITVGYSSPNITLSSTAFRQVVQRTFSSSATYTPTSGMKFCEIKIVGGGAGSGGAATTGAGQIACGGGGGGGAYSVGVFSAAQIGASISVTIGAAGTPGGTEDAFGGAGGNTSVGSLITAGGGFGGGGGVEAPISNASAGTGGSSGGPAPFFGGEGGTGSIGSFASGFIIPGNGGSSYFGGRSVSPIIGVGAGASPGVSPSAISRGCGASGSAVGENTTGIDGAAGSAGYVLITEYI